MTSRIYSPAPRRSRKRKVLELEDFVDAPHIKRSRVSLSTEVSIVDWLQQTSLPIPNRPCSTRPSTAPPRLGEKFSVDQRDSGNHSDELFLHDMSRGRPTIQRPPTNDSIWSRTPSTTSRFGTGDRRYLATLGSNGLRLDRTGLKMDKEMQTFVENHITKGRSSPPLTEEELTEVVDMADGIADSSEGVVLDLLRTQMFPLKRAGLAEGGNSQWTKEALPSNPDSPNKLAIPKPDRHIGYPAPHRSDFTNTECLVLNHPTALPYTQPAIGNTLPILVVEFKSEASGGNLWHAENQAGGSGAHCVNAMRWLLQQASGSVSRDSIGLTQAPAFSLCVTARQVVLYIHYYSPQSKLYWMSFVDSYMPTNLKDVQRCKTHVNNILDYALGARLQQVKDALGELFPYPEHWSNKKRSSSTTASTPATSLTGNEKARD